MISEMSEITAARCGATRQICRSLRYSAISLPLKYGLALFDKGFCGFLVVGGVARTRVVDRFGVKTGFQRHRLGVVDVALDVTQRHRWSLRQRHREIMRFGIDVGVRNLF